MMDTLEILSRVRMMAEHWGGAAINMAPVATEKETAIRKSAAMDFRIIQTEIEKSLDEMTDGLLKQEQENNK